VIEIVVPQVGEATSEVTLVRWLKSEGDAVEKDEPLFEVDTDKYVVEIQAFESGVLTEILVPAGSPVMPLDVVARLTPVGERGQAEAARPRATAGSHPGERVERTLASPKARRIAADLGVDLTRLAGRGSGPGGLVTADDVVAAAPQAPDEPAGTVRELSRARRSIAARMRASKQEVPHFYLLVDADMAEAQRLREWSTQAGGWEQPPSVTELVTAACARTLDALPEANASFSEGGLVLRSRANIGIAVAVDDGLVVPVVRDAARLDLRELTQQVEAAVERARSGRLLESDVGERSLVVSNLGMYGVDAFVAIIDPPDPMILALGRIADRCVPIDGVPAVRPMCTLTLSVDHRAFDGVVGARFLSGVRQRLESPFELLEAE
jgi:pyruvate dehydrogenase E2 component (dihydrolipoamide acetyltransferase)